MVEKTSGGTTFTTPSDREIRMTRVFNAPRELVFQVTRTRITSRIGGDRGE